MQLKLLSQRRQIIESRSSETLRLLRQSKDFFGSTETIRRLLSIEYQHSRSLCVAQWLIRLSAAKRSR